MDHLESIRVFVKVADTASFTRAADSLALSTAVTTRLVAALEQRLGARLLQRTTRRVSLTETGEIFLARARGILEEVAEAESMVASLQRVPAGILRIAAPVAFGLRYLSPLLKGFTETYPLVVPHVTLSNNPIDLVERRFDVAMIPDGDHYGNTLVMRRFTSSRQRLVAAPDYLARRGTPQQVADLEQHVCLSHSDAEASAAQHLLQPIKPPLRRVETEFVANDLEMLYRFTMAGLGIAVLPGYLVQAEIDAGRLVHLLPALELPLLHLNIAFTSRKNMAMKVRRFVDFLIQEFSVAGSWHEAGV